MSGKPGMKRPKVRLRNDREVLIAAPSENQLEEAMAAFAVAKLRHRLIQIHDTMFVVRVLPEHFGVLTVANGKPPPESLTYQDIRFHNELSARQWREREIIREAITKGMRAKP